MCKNNRTSAKKYLEFKKKNKSRFKKPVKITLMTIY